MLILGVFPKILKTSKKIQKFKQNEFLGFGFSLVMLDLFKFINIYLPITDIVKNLYFKYNFMEYRLTINFFPVINEVDKICETNTPLLDFIKDYKFVLKIKLNALN